MVPRARKPPVIALRAAVHFAASSPRVPTPLAALPSSIKSAPSSGQWASGMLPNAAVPAFAFSWADTLTWQNRPVNANKSKSRLVGKSASNLAGSASCRSLRHASALRPLKTWDICDAECASLEEECRAGTGRSGCSQCREQTRCTEKKRIG